MRAAATANMHSSTAAVTTAGGKSSRPELAATAEGNTGVGGKWRLLSGKKTGATGLDSTKEAGVGKQGWSRSGGRATGRSQRHGETKATTTTNTSANAAVTGGGGTTTTTRFSSSLTIQKHSFSFNKLIIVSPSLIN